MAFEEAVKMTTTIETFVYLLDWHTFLITIVRISEFISLLVSTLNYGVIQQIVIHFFLALDDASSLSRAHFPPAEIGSHSHDVHRGKV